MMDISDVKEIPLVIVFLEAWNLDLMLPFSGSTTAAHPLLPRTSSSRIVEVVVEEEEVDREATEPSTTPDAVHINSIVDVLMHLTSPDVVPRYKALESCNQGKIREGREEVRYESKEESERNSDAHFQHNVFVGR